MNVLLWSQYFWPENFRINELVVMLKQRGMQVTVLTGKPNYPEGKFFSGYRMQGVQREQYAGAEVVRVPVLPRGSGSALRLMLNYLSFIFSGFFFAPFVLRGCRFDVVFVYAPSPLLQALPATLLARLHKAPLLVWVQDLWPESLEATGFVRNPWLLGAVKAAVRYIYQRTDSILIQSEAFRVPVARLVDNREKIRYFPNTAEPLTNAQACQANAPLVSDLKKTFSVVLAGNIGVAQSIETVVMAADALRAHSHIRFFIIGSGSRDGWLRQEVVRLHLNNVKFVGRLPYSEMPAIFSAASVLLVTLKDEKAFSRTVPSRLQAYFSAGRPIIACLNGEGARIVNEADAGIVCPAEDWQALAVGVLKMSALAPDEHKRLGGNGLRYFNANFEPTQRANELIEHFQNIVEQKRKANKQ